MSGGYNVKPAELASHAARVQSIAGSISKAADAAKTEGVMGSGNPYGVFTVLVVPTLGTAAAAAGEFIAGLGDSATDMSTAVKNNADVYQSVEDFLLAQIGKLIP